MPWQKGEENREAKLTEEQVRAIRRDPRLNKEVAYDYGITTHHAWRIRRRLRWAHVPDDPS